MSRSLGRYAFGVNSTVRVGLEHALLVEGPQLTNCERVVGRCLRRVVGEVVQLPQAVGRHLLSACGQLRSLLLASHLRSASVTIHHYTKTHCDKPINLRGGLEGSIIAGGASPGPTRRRRASPLEAGAPTLMRELQSWSDEVDVRGNMLWQVVLVRTGDDLTAAVFSVVNVVLRAEQFLGLFYGHVSVYPRAAVADPNAVRPETTG